MTAITRRAATFSSLLLAALPEQPAQAADPLSRHVNGIAFDRFVELTLRDFGVPGAVVAIAGPKGMIFLKGYGVRQRGEAGAVDEHTRFQIASVSKLVAATAVGVLVDRGVVSWDAPVRTFSSGTALAEPYATENATLRDYLAHRTGLPAYAADLLTQLGLGPDELVRRARFLAFDHSFRSAWAYSNYGIFLGQQSAADAAGMSAPDLLSKAILEPCGMARSGPTRATLLEDDNRAAAHDMDGRVMEHENVDAFSGAGAVVSTGADIARWMQMLLAGGMLDGRPVLTKSTVAQIFAASMVQGPGGPLRDPNDCSGLGCESYRFLRWRVIEKNGALNGMRTIVTLVPERGIGIAVFANRQLTLFPEAARAEFLEHVLGPTGRNLQAQIRGEQEAWDRLLDLPKPPADARPLGRDLDAFTGRYASPLYGTLEVLRQGQELRVRVGEVRYPGRLGHWSGNTFLLTFANPDITPGLVTFAFAGGQTHATAFDGSRVPHAFTTDYGRFDRMA